MIPASWVRKGPAGHPSVGWQLGEGCALAPLPEGADSAHSTPLQPPAVCAHLLEARGAGDLSRLSTCRQHLEEQSGGCREGQAGLGAP